MSIGQSAWDSTAHEHLFSQVRKRYLFSHCSLISVNSRLFRKVTFQPRFRQCSKNRLNVADSALEAVSLIRIRIRIRMFLGLPDSHLDPLDGSGSFHHKAKKVRKTLISIVLVFPNDFFSSKNDVNVPLFRIRIRIRIRMFWGLSDPEPDWQTDLLIADQRPILMLKVHKIENFFGSEFEFYTISLLVMLKY